MGKVQDKKLIEKFRLTTALLNRWSQMSIQSAQINAKHSEREGHENG